MTDHRPRLTDRLLSARDAHALLGIPVATIRSWHQRNRATGLYPKGMDHRGALLFLGGDLMKLRRGEKIRHADGDWIEE